MLVVQLAEEKDACDFATILNKSWKDTYSEYVPISHIDKEFNIEELIKNFPDTLSSSDELYMLKLNGKNIGVLKIGKPEDIYKQDMERYGEVLSFHILKDYCGKGYGKIALDFAQKRLKELGFKHICLWVKKQNIKAINFYLKNGFVKTEYSCDDTIDGAPSFVMEKYNI